MILLHDYVAIEPDGPPETTESGLYLHKQINTYPPQGTVKYVADGVTGVKPGDRVVYKVYASVDLEENLAVVPLEGVIAKLDA